jgi:hypothetical protein
MEKAGQRLPISAGSKSIERALDSQREINGKGSTNLLSGANFLHTEKEKNHFSQTWSFDYTCLQQLTLDNFPAATSSSPHVARWSVPRSQAHATVQLSLPSVATMCFNLHGSIC